MVVDPRLSVTVARADEWIPINPGTDGALATYHIKARGDLVYVPHYEEPIFIGLGLLAGELESLVASLQAGGEPLELPLVYTRLFRGPVKAEAYPYESMYIDGGIMGEAALDVMRRYREAGVQVSGDFKDLPDHVCAELEFMCYLCTQESQALQAGDWDRAACTEQMSRSFLKAHLARWVPRFADRILQHATTPFYLSLARITEEFMHCEAAEAIPSNPLLPG